MVYCCVPFCTSKSGKSTGISFHDFPVNPNLCQQWLKVISRADFKPNFNSYSQAVCSLHFQDEDYRPGLKIRRLKPFRVPSIFPGYPAYKVPKVQLPRKLTERKCTQPKSRKSVEEKQSEHFEIGGSTSSVIDDSFLPSATEKLYNELHNTARNGECSTGCQTTWNVNEELRKGQKQTAALRAKINRLNNRLSILQSRLDSAQEKEYYFSKNKFHAALEDIIKAAENNQNDDLAHMLLEQISNYGKKKPRWDPKTLQKCVGLRFCSPKAYSFARRQNILKLPSKSTLSEFIGDVSCETGVTSLIKNRLKREIANLNDSEKFVSLIIDEMYIKSQLIYDKKVDGYFGQADVSTHVSKLKSEANTVEIKNKVVLANNLLCFMVQGLSTNYRIPAAFFFSKQLCGRDLYVLMLSVLKEIESIGFCVVRLVTDNHKTNVAMMKNLAGGKLAEVVDHPLDHERKLFLSFDPCHIIKNIRNLFLEKKMPDGDGIISAEYIKTLYEIQNTEIVKLVRFLTRKHIEPTNFEKMNVKRAVQIFWPQVIAALKFLKDNLSSHSKAYTFVNASSTIKFMEYVQKWFIMHNISNKSHYITSLDSNRMHFFDVEDDRLEWLEQSFLPYIEKLNEASKLENKVFLSKETYEALVMTTKSTVSCIKYLLNNGFHYVLTRNFSSDAVELFFSSLRQMSGSNDMLDSRAVIFNFNHILKSGTMSIPMTSNVCVDDEVSSSNFIASSSTNKNIKNMSIEKALSMVPEHALEILKRFDNIPTNQKITMTLASLSYIGGYLIKKLTSYIKGDCSSCVLQLLQPKQSSPLTKFIEHQDRGSLIYPNIKFVLTLCIIQDFVKEALPAVMNCADTSAILCKILEQKLCDYGIFECPNDTSHFPIVWELICKDFVPLLLKNFASAETDKYAKRKLIFSKPLGRKILKVN